MLKPHLYILYIYTYTLRVCVCVPSSRALDILYGELNYGDIWGYGYPIIMNGISCNGNIGNIMLHRKLIPVKGDDGPL